MHALTRQNGFTLLEVMFSVAIITVVIGVLMGMAIGLGDTAQTQDIKGTSGDQVRRGMIYVVRDLRQSNGANISGLPGDVITYRTAADTDGNGTAVNVNGNAEFGPLITLGRDVNDLNEDGLTTTQLIWSNGTENRVRANNLLPNEDANNNGVLDAGEDLNNNAVLDRGLWFSRTGPLIEVSIQAGGRNRNGRLITFNLSEAVRPRN